MNFKIKIYLKRNSKKEIFYLGEIINNEIISVVDVGLVYEPLLKQVIDKEFSFEHRINEYTPQKRHLKRIMKADQEDLLKRLHVFKAVLKILGFKMSIIKIKET